jgi:hypothetical protein
MVLMVHREFKESKAMQVQRERMVQMALTEQTEQMAQPVHRDYRVFKAT